MNGFLLTGFLLPPPFVSTLGMMNVARGAAMLLSAGFPIPDLPATARYPGAGEELIQVCADVSRPETPARELRALGAAAREHPRAVRRVLVLDRDALATPIEAPGVVVQPAYEWLLAEAGER